MVESCAPLGCRACSVFAMHVPDAWLYCVAIHSCVAIPHVIGISSPREIEKFITRQPPIAEKDDYDSENSWISDGSPPRTIFVFFLFS